MSKCNVCQNKQKGKLYDAIIVEVRQSSDGQYSYKIHYKRWNKRMDEFVPASRIVKVESKSSTSQECGPILSEQQDGIINELAEVRNETKRRLPQFINLRAQTTS